MTFTDIRRILANALIISALLFGLVCAVYLVGFMIMDGKIMDL